MTTRRELLRNTALFSGAALLGSQILPSVSAQSEDPFEAPDNPIYAVILGWKIGPQIYSFNRFPFDEAIQKVRACDVASFELYSGQKLSKKIDVRVGPDLLKPANKDAFKRFRELLAENECVPHAMGVCPGNREHFEFAATVGISVLNCEPGFDKLAEVNKLAEEYRISVGLHNHPKPSIYWDPQIVLDHLKDCSTRIGACCDTGHWYRSGLDPLECVQKFKGRIVSFHIKDLNEQKRDIPLGKGVCKIAEILQECAVQRVNAPFSIEYESDWDNNQPLVAEGVRFFRQTAKKIVQDS
ncbi:MAG: sugar phosphate isomerase/epimerase [Planctomycetaceae bacterium]|jgi:sugar phosphate isomerase/epimerase|nr:sugar phosphate isomerase/epimerase [Planctomycetaceae bacterium]